MPISEIHVVGYPFSLYTPTSAQVRLAIMEELANEHAVQTATLATRLPRYDRQIRAYGPELQRILASLRVGIVGISGTGSHLAVELAYLGVGDFVLCDPETIGVENLNRILGATDEDVGKPKVAYAEKIITAINRWAQVHPLQCSVLEDSAVASLKTVDVLFGCTDTASSRMLMNDLACQFHIPYIDLGTGIFVSEQRITDMGGQLHILLPDSPCLDCREALNRERAGQELMTDDQKALHRARGYVLGDEVVQPQVIQLNGVVVNQALMEFINLLAAFKPYQPYLVYDALKPAFLAVEVGHVPGCLPCSRRGAGDSQGEEINHVDTGIETNTPDTLCEQATTGGCMAKPIPLNPNFRKRTTQVTRKKPGAPPPPPVTPPATTSQKDTPSRSLARVAQALPTAPGQPLPPPPVKPPQITVQTTPTRRGTLRNWLSHLPRLF